MARSKQLRFVQGSVIVGGEQNSDATHTLAVQAEQMRGTVTIPSGQSLSPVLDTGGRRLAAIQIPAAWTAAPLTFQASADGGLSYVDVYDDSGAEVTLAITANRLIVLDALAVVLAPFRYMKFRSGPSAGGIPQGADRALNFLVRGL